MPKCHKCYPNFQWTVTYCWVNLALDTVLLTKVYWSYSTHILRLCFTPLLKPTFKRDLKRKNIVQVNFNSLAMASLHELCVTILLNTSIQLWMNFVLSFILHCLHFLHPQQLQPFYPKQRMVISTTLRMNYVFFIQNLDCAIPKQRILPTQRTSTGIRRLTQLGRITPLAGVAQSRHRKPPASAKDLTRSRKTTCGQLSIA